MRSLAAMGCSFNNSPKQFCAQGCLDLLLELHFFVAVLSIPHCAQFSRAFSYGGAGVQRARCEMCNVAAP
eukprot:11212901-Lingulodinium_polyedra.AAC.1